MRRPGVFPSLCSKGKRKLHRAHVRDLMFAMNCPSLSDAHLASRLLSLPCTSTLLHVKGLETWRQIRKLRSGPDFLAAIRFGCHLPHRVAYGPSSSPQPVPAHLGSELFDAIVQAADPKHPDHAAWHDRYASLSIPSSRTSVASTHSRDKLPASSSPVSPPTLRRSLDHSDPSARRKTPSRKVGIRDLPYRPTHEATGSDADDPIYDDPAYSSKRASFEGSLRSFRSVSATSSGQRRRNRRLHGSPKPLVPPIPPPRVTSSTNWQSTFGSPSMPDLAGTSTSFTQGHPSSSNTSDNRDPHLTHARSNYLLASPSAPSSLRSTHPYASAVAFREEPEQDVQPLPPRTGGGHSCSLQTNASRSSSNRAPLQNSTSSLNVSARVGRASMDDAARRDRADSHSLRIRRPSALAVASPPSPLQATQRTNVHHAAEYTAAPRKSMSKIRQLLGSEASDLAARPLQGPVRSPLPTERKFDTPTPLQTPAQESIARNAKQTAATAQTPAVNPRAAWQSHDGPRSVDLNIFPMRRDDEFRTNEFEMDSSDDMEAETETRFAQMSPPGYSCTSPSSTVRSDRRPGVVRRSLDSIISPFRAGLLNGKSSGPHATTASASGTEQIAEGRVSFSESRFAKPFVPRQRTATMAGRTRPLSRVIDCPDDELEETLQPLDLDAQDRRATRSSPRAGNTNASLPDASASSITGSQSVASTYSQSTSHLHDTSVTSHAPTIVHQRSRGKLGGLLTKFKGSSSSRAVNLPTSPASDTQSSSRSAQTLYQQYPLSEHALPITASPSFSVISTDSPATQRPERPFRARVKSLTTLSSSGSKGQLDDVPPVPAIPVAFAAPDNNATRSVWEESPSIPSSSTFPSEHSSGTIGRLLRRKKAQQKPNVVFDNVAPPPSQTSPPSLLVEEQAEPRSSMSSARARDGMAPSGASTNIAQSRTTIRKTLSPALLSDTLQPSIESGLRSEQQDVLSTFPTSQGDRPVADHGDASLHSTSDDPAEEMADAETDEQRFRSPLKRFIRGQASVDRLSRVDELSERLSWMPEADQASELRLSASMPLPTPSTHSPRSFGEHRSMRRSISGNLREHTAPSSLQIDASQKARPRKTSLDILRPMRKRSDTNLHDSDQLALSSSLRSPSTFLTSTPKSPATPGMREQLTPSWRPTGFGAPRSGRSSFSQDRDRAPVASPMSPPLPSGRGVGQAFRRLGRKNKSNKGIGPADVIIVDRNDDVDGNEVPGDWSWRPSMSTEPRPSFGTDARPSFSGLLRPTVGGGDRPSFDSISRPEVGVSSLMPSPVTSSFATNGPRQRPSKELSKSTASVHASPADEEGRSASDGSVVAGLGINAIAWTEAVPSQKGENNDLSGSTSDGTFTTHGVSTPENGSLSHSCMSQMPTRSDLTGATTPLAGRVSMDVVSQPTPPPVKSAELLALEAMLGRFPQQEKVLLQDISARVAQGGDV
ncbi:CMGC/DYRK/DYRK2 protein kinase [Pseudozyma hubeiensis SY62]|uniref:CMGC/DYRK/DYRK2 protein kinase n=1 Tax=Pseudozyma hubeiensis (strain SY62) TaxID=1305764 RepID=R9PEB1_PSEHS|nr:CMGC/DYRK/DYRK2 protein kinase [Pseudozyma hubeiensis SY62]GAC99708.1 CMGC/DYRK/DYRK2 protein kinase [Pseudozyma hubeiensis SY62]